MSLVDETVLANQRIEQAQKKEIESKQVENTSVEEQCDVAFEKREVLGLLELEVPTDSQTLEEDVIRSLYPMGNPPQYVLASELADLSIGFHYTTNELSNSDMVPWAGFAKQLMERIGPNAETFGVKSFERGAYKIAHFEAITSGLDGGVYNLNFYASIQGKLLIGFVNFPSEDIKKKKQLAHKILHSIHILEE